MLAIPSKTLFMRMAGEVQLSESRNEIRTLGKARGMWYCTHIKQRYGEDAYVEENTKSSDDRSGRGLSVLRRDGGGGPAPV